MYNLSNEEFTAWFDEAVRPQFLQKEPVSADQQPTFVLLTSQPGGGKTSASSKYAQTLSPEPIRFGADDLRIMLPYAQEVLANDEANYPFVTKKDASKAREQIITEGLAKRQNILVESILSNPNDWKLDTVLRAKNAGYRIELGVLGVHYFVSQVSMFARYEDQKVVTGYGFPPTMEVHDRTYQLLPEIAAKMFEEGVADRVKVFNRSAKVFYDTDNEKNPSGMNIMQGIKRARNSYLNYDMMRNVVIKWEDVLEKMNSRQAKAGEIENVQMLYSTFKKDSGIVMAANVALTKGGRE